MKYWIDKIYDSLDFDVIVFDSPPTLAVSDSAALAALLDAKVLLIVLAGSTRRGVGVKAKQRFDSIGAEVVGVILNGSNLREEEYYGYGYSYYYAPQLGEE
jgi:Mrp family chromosome partitioning ATPase